MNHTLSLLAITATLLLGNTTLHAQESDKAKKFGPNGIVRVPYAMPDKPKDGFNSMTFTVRIDEAPERSRSFYYAMQFKFIGGNGGYIGIQPRGGNQGMAVFSVFGKGAVPVAENCRGGADGGQGVSCSKPFTIAYKTDYYLEVVRDKEDPALWHGFLKNNESGEQIDIGSWKPRPSSKGLEGKNAGFVEYFPLITSCADITATKGFFGHPSAKTAEGKQVSGKIGALTTYGRCKDIAFTTKQTKHGSSLAILP